MDAAIRRQVGGRILFLRAEEIDWIAAADNYVELHAGRASHLVRTTLKSIEQKLEPARFVRVHRSAIVNVESVKQFIPSAHGDCELVLRDGTRVHAQPFFSFCFRFCNFFFCFFCHFLRFTFHSLFHFLDHCFYFSSCFCSTFFFSCFLFYCFFFFKNRCTTNC